MNFNLRKRLAKDIKNLDYDLNTIIYLLFKDFLTAFNAGFGSRL
jgi:hypothetical protein